MQRRKLVGAVVAALALVILAGCGGSDATPSPSAEASAPAGPAATQAPASEAPSSAPEATKAAKEKLLAICAGVAVRNGPSTGNDLLARVAKLSKVRVVETVQGDPYDAGACGTSGSDWLKIDRINGTSVKKLYGVKYGYAAAGFFQ